MNRFCTRRTLLASLSAAYAFGPSACATSSTEQGARRIDAATIQGPLGARLQDYLTRASAFGLAGTALVAIDDTLVLHQGYGLANLERRTPNTVRTLYDFGSTTKTMTAGAILLLASEGRLSVSDEIGRHFSDVPPDKQGITLEHLLTHTSGIIDPPMGDYEPIGRDELVRIVLASNLDGAPGATYNYSNAGFSMLAAIIEKVTEIGYETFMRQRLFLPAGMTTTGYTLPTWDPELVAHTYTYPVDHGSPLQRLRAAHGPGWILMGNGGLIGTTGDLYRWLGFFRSGSVIPADQVATAITPHYWRTGRDARGFDWEIEVTDSGQRSYGHASDAPFVGLNGWIGYYSAQGASIAWLANNRLNGASSRHFVITNIRRIIDGDEVPLPPMIATIATRDLQKAEGRFIGDTSTIDVRATHGYLEVGANGKDAVDLFNARQGESAVTEAWSLDERANAFVRALEQRDAIALAGFVDGQLETEALLTNWRDAQGLHGRLQEATVLGTFRLDRRAFVTTIRFDFANGPVHSRFSWQNGKIAPSSEDLFLPSLAGPLKVSPVPYAAWQPFWYPQHGALFTFDLLTGTRREINTIERDGQIIELVFERPSGQVNRWIRRESG